MNSDQVRAIALEAGFGSVGIGQLRFPKRPEVHDAWIEAGCHGEMAWMESHRDVAADPNLVLPGAIRAICVLDRYPGSASEHVPPRFGRVARYARGKDYHVHTLKRLPAARSDCHLSFLKGLPPAWIPCLCWNVIWQGGRSGADQKHTLLIEPKKALGRCLACC